METFLDKYLAQIRVLHLTDSDPENREQNGHIEELLEISKGLKETQIHYRVYLVAALILQQNLEAQAISEAKEVVFTGFQKPIESLLGLQRAYDLANNLEIPAGFTAQEYLDRLCGCKEGGFGSASIMSAFTV